MHDEVFRVVRQDSIDDGFTNGDGTGTVFDFENQTFGSTTYCRMCLVTADHVLNGTTLGGLGFRNENPQGTFGANAFNFTPIQSVVRLGSSGIPTANGWAGGGVDKPDIAFIGVSVDLGNVGGNPPSGPAFNNATKSLLLQAAAADAVPLAAIGPDVFPGFVFHGFGDSGRFPTPDEVMNVAGAGDYEYLRHDNADDEQYGILRRLTDTVTILEFEDAQNGTLAGLPYQYEEALGWQLTGGKHYGLGGDSGSALVDDTGHIIGIFNLSESDTFDPAVANIVEGVKLGMLEYAVALTVDYVDWLNGRCEQFLDMRVPEPSTCMLLLVAIVLGELQHRRMISRDAKYSAAIN